MSLVLTCFSSSDPLVNNDTELIELLCTCAVNINDSPLVFFNGLFNLKSMYVLLHLSSIDRMLCVHIMITHKYKTSTKLSLAIDQTDHFGSDTFKDLVLKNRFIDSFQVNP